MTSNFDEIKAVVALTSIKSLEKTDRNIPTPSSSDGKDLGYLIMDIFRFFNKYETILQKTNFSRR